MDSKKTANSFSLTLFNIYRKKDSNEPLPEPPTFAYATKDGETHHLPFLLPEEDGDKAMRSALHRFYPLAGKAFKTKTGRMFWTADAYLLKELRQAWLINDGPLSVRFQEAGAFLFEEEYLLLYFEVCPDMATTGTDDIAGAAVNITYALSGKSNRAELVKAGRNQQAKDSARNRFQGNEHLPLIQGILGKHLTLEDMFDTLAGPGWTSMLNDRFLLKSLIVTPVNDPAPTYSRADEDNLVRLARGMNDKYLPPPLAALSGHVVPMRTFANVLFMAANEGVAGHVKPAPGQKFLHDQFAGRYRTGYTLLFVLAAYQHYRLIDLSRKLAEQTENPNERERVKRLRQIRQDFALHELKYIIIQPVFLTNSQQYYNGLRQGLNTGALVEKLRHSVAELDALLAAEELRRAEEEQKERKEQKEQDEKGKMIMAVTAEMVALPYYLHSLLVHALHFNNHWALAITGIVTAGVVTKTLLIMRGRKAASSGKKS